MMEAQSAHDFRFFYSRRCMCLLVDMIWDNPTAFIYNRVTCYQSWYLPNADILLTGRSPKRMSLGLNRAILEFLGVAFSITHYGVICGRKNSHYYRCRFGNQLLLCEASSPEAVQRHPRRPSPSTGSKWAGLQILVQIRFWLPPSHISEDRRY